MPAITRLCDARYCWMKEKSWRTTSHHVVGAYLKSGLGHNAARECAIGQKRRQRHCAPGAVRIRTEDNEPKRRPTFVSLRRRDGSMKYCDRPRPDAELSLLQREGINVFVAPGFMLHSGGVSRRWAILEYRLDTGKLSGGGYGDRGGRVSHI